MSHSRSHPAEVNMHFRRLRLWWMRQHSYSRLWPFCWDCRLAQQAWAKGEFYSHDEPRWYVNECLADGTVDGLVTMLPVGHFTLQPMRENRTTGGTTVLLLTTTP